jgi:hypothetical protein
LLKKVIQTQLILMNLLTYVSLTSTVFVHQTVDTSAHTNYLISIVKEQIAWEQAKTDNYEPVPNPCQQTEIPYLAQAPEIHSGHAGEERIIHTVIRRSTTHFERDKPATFSPVLSLC